MKKIICILVTVLLPTIFAAQAPKGKAKPGTIYGAKLDASNAVAAGTLPALVKKGDSVNVKLKGKVLNSCASKGCWMTLQVNETTEAFIKMKDYGFFVPTDIQGKTVVVEGVSYIKTTSIDDLKHYAEDAKKSQAEIDAITQAKDEFRIMANGILVVE